MEIREILNQCAVTGCVGLLIYSFSSPLGAAMYKWVDAEGNVHYTQTKPEADVETEIIKPQEPADNTELDKEFSERKARERGYQEYRKEKEKEQELINKEKERYAANCKSSKELLEKLQSLRRFRVKDEEGNPKWASNEDHQATIDRVKDNVKKFCK